MNPVVLAIQTDLKTTRGLKNYCAASGYPFVEAKAGDQWFPGRNNSPPNLTPGFSPDISVIRFSGNETADREFITAFQSAHPECEIILQADPSEIKQAMARFKSLTREFIPAPVDDMTLEVTLTRIFEKIALKSQLKKQETAFSALSGSTAAGLAETDRFIFVRQLVDKLSSFIAQIAKDVEGGIKYFHSTPYFVSIHTADRKIIAHDAGFQKYFGDMKGKNSWDIYYGKAGTPETCPVGRTLQTGTVQRTAAAVRYQSGAKTPVIVHTAPVYNQNGQMELVLEVASGSREIKALKKDLKTTQQKYQKLFEAVPDYIAVVDRKFRISAANHRFQDEFGDRTGADFFDVFQKKNFSETDCPLFKTLKDGKSHQIETELTTPDGRRLNILLSTAPVTAIGEKVVQIIVIFKDITHLRQIEDRLSTLGLMFSVVSHNIKGILTGLDAGLYHIDRGFYKNIPGRIEEGMEVATLMVERIRKMILDVLYYAKPRDLHLKRVNIAELIGDAGKQVRPKMGTRDIAFSCQADNATGEIEADRELLLSVILNLLDNAMDACLNSHLDRQFRISLTAEDLFNQVQFQIIDNGSGMTEEQTSRIFSKFYSTKGHKGTGLGLFIASQVIRAHNGTIQVASSPAGGSRFTITLPKKATKPIK